MDKTAATRRFCWQITVLSRSIVPHPPDPSPKEGEGEHASRFPLSQVGRGVREKPCANGRRLHEGENHAARMLVILNAKWNGMPVRLSLVEMIVFAIAVQGIEYRED